MKLPHHALLNLFSIVLAAGLGTGWWLQVRDLGNAIRRLEAAEADLTVRAESAEETVTTLLRYRKQQDQEWLDAVEKMDTKTKERVLEAHRNIRDRHEREWKRLKKEAADQDTVHLPKR